jgi:hypothetical protein
MTMKNLLLILTHQEKILLMVVEGRKYTNQPKFHRFSKAFRFAKLRIACYQVFCAKNGDWF